MECLCVGGVCSAEVVDAPLHRTGPLCVARGSLAATMRALTLICTLPFVRILLLA
jgi:hypothetical protein